MKKLTADKLFDTSMLTPIPSIGDNNHHIYFRSINDFISLDTKIYRYMRLDHMMDMLLRSQLYVSNRRYFTDIKDWNGEEKWIPQPNMLFRPVFIPSYRDKKWVREAEEKKNYAMRLCVLCWTLDELNNGSVDENFLMWKAYKSCDLMCRVGTTIDKFIHNIQPPCDVVISDVSYGTNHSGAYPDRLTFNKSIYYSAEKEVRAAFLDTSSHLEVKIKDMDDFIESITLSPFLHPNIESMMMRMLKNSFPRYESRLHQSKLMEYNNYKDNNTFKKFKPNPKK